MFCGCQSHWKLGAGSARADVRCRVFEISKEIAEKTIPKTNRREIDNSVHSVVSVSKAESASLLENVSDKPGILRDHSRTRSRWPREADAWCRSIANEVIHGSAGGAGFLGVRSLYGRLEIRIQYSIFHTVNTREPLQSRIVYEGLFPAEGSLAFFAPFERRDGTERVHVILFDVTNWEQRLLW